MRLLTASARSTPVVLALSVLAAATATASAQNVFDDFSSGNDNAWTRLDSPAGFGLGTSSYSVANEQYTITTPTMPNVGLSIPSAAFRADGFAVNSQVSVDVTGFTGVPVISLGARGFQAPSGGISYYSLSFFPISRATGPNGEARSNFRIDRLNANPATPGISTLTNLTSFDGNAFPAVNPANTFRMVFTLEGNLIAASLYDLTTAPTVPLVNFALFDNDPGALLGPGVPSVDIYSNTAPGLTVVPSVSATFDNFRVIPAPGAAALLGVGGLMAGRRRR